MTRSDASRILARAHVLGARLDVRALAREHGFEQTGSAPLTLRVGARGQAVAFRFGVVVSFELEAGEQRAFLESIAPAVDDPYPEPESDSLAVEVAGGDGAERLRSDGVLELHALSVKRLQTVAHVLAKSTVLSYYEGEVAGVFDRIEEMGEQLRQGKIPTRRKELLAEIGSVLLIQARTVGRAEVTEKPEITWDAPELDRLYEHLAMEYELRDRDLALSRKLNLISEIAETYLNLLQNRQAIRVEWYIVWLIVIEILLIFYEWTWL